MFAWKDRPVYLPGVIAVAVLILGVFAWITAGPNGNSKATGAQDCPPVARDDAAATKPHARVVVDVLANDTDVDGDTLSFSTISVSEGEAGVDDGGTASDTADDKMIYTPAEVASPTASIEYRVSDPSGESSTAHVTVAVNDAGVLPDGLISADPTDPSSSPTISGCGGGANGGNLNQTGATPTTPTSFDYSVTPLPSTFVTNGSSGSSSKTTSKSTGKKGTSTTAKNGSSNGSNGGNGNTNTGGNGTSITFDTSPGITAPPHTTTTPKPPSTTPPGPPPCHDKKSCEDYANSQNPMNTTTTAPPATTTTAP